MGYAIKTVGKVTTTLTNLQDIIDAALIVCRCPNDIVKSKSIDGKRGIKGLQYVEGELKYFPDPKAISLENDAYLSPSEQQLVKSLCNNGDPINKRGASPNGDSTFHLGKGWEVSFVARCVGQQLSVDITRGPDGDVDCICGNGRKIDLKALDSIYPTHFLEVVKSNQSCPKQGWDDNTLFVFGFMGKMLTDPYRMKGWLTLGELKNFYRMNAHLIDGGYRSIYCPAICNLKKGNLRFHLNLVFTESMLHSTGLNNEIARNLQTSLIPIVLHSGDNTIYLINEQRTRCMKATLEGRRLEIPELQQAVISKELKSYMTRLEMDAFFGKEKFTAFGNLWRYKHSQDSEVSAFGDELWERVIGSYETFGKIINPIEI